MNILDKFITSVNPVHGARRAEARARIARAEEFTALMSGYSEGGASHSRSAMKGYRGISADPQSDIDANLRTLISRSRQEYMTSPIATSAINTTRTNVVGAGLMLKSRIDWKLLKQVCPMDKDHAVNWQTKTEREFGLWANSTWCDSMHLNTFAEQQALFFLGELMNGDGLCLTEMADETPWMPYGLRLRLIEGDRLCTPGVLWSAASGQSMYWGVNTDNQNKIYSGVEFDRNGATVGYWFCNQYPYKTRLSPVEEAPKWTRVPAYGPKTGRPNVLHMFEPERAEQRRGVPFLSPVLSELHQLKRYEDAELMAALINALFTAFVTTNGSTTELPVGEAANGMPAPDGEPIPQKGDDEYRLGPGSVTVLAQGEDVKFADPKRPSTAFEAFVSAVSQSIGAALEIPNELLLKKFSASYSASRGALLEAWKMFRMRRTRLKNAFCQPVYELWLTEAVARGRVNAPGFFEDPIVRAAWCSADWNGPAAGMLDPVREVTAAKMRVQEGFSTREEETTGLTGGNYTKNTEQLTTENEQLAGAVKPLTDQQGGKGNA